MSVFSTPKARLIVGLYCPHVLLNQSVAPSQILPQLRRHWVRESPYRISLWPCGGR